MLRSESDGGAGPSRSMKYRREHRIVICALLVSSFIALNAEQPNSAKDSAFSSVHKSLLPANARSCSECHAAPVVGGSSRVTVTRVAERTSGRNIGMLGSGVRHTMNSETSNAARASIRGTRVSINLLGDGYIESVDGEEFRRISSAQAKSSNGRIHGEVVQLKEMEGSGHPNIVGRFGWKSQHASLLGASADALRNELGIPNRVFSDNVPRAVRRDESPVGAAEGQGELDAMVVFIRDSEPITPDAERSATEWARTGSRVFDRIGCSTCHVRTLRTAAPGTKLEGSKVTVSQRLGNRQIHPFSDYLVHDVGTGDGIVQNVRTQDYAASTANKFRTAPLWGVRFRTWLMHDGASVTYHQAIMRHAGEASQTVDNYEHLTPIEKEQLRQFLDSL
jgi:CxxC motif-containing protein (DUF1111 family)